MKIVIDNDGAMKKIVFGRNATKTTSDTIFEIPSGYKVTKNTSVDIGAMELRNCASNQSQFCITEFTKEEVFCLEGV
jgi:hypothetical protein